MNHRLIYIIAGYKSAQQGGGFGGQGGGFGGANMGGDPFDIFNSIFKEFNQGGGQGQGGFNFGNFQQQFRNQPKVSHYFAGKFEFLFLRVGFLATKLHETIILCRISNPDIFTRVKFIP